MLRKVIQDKGNSLVLKHGSTTFVMQISPQMQTVCTKSAVVFDHIGFATLHAATIVLMAPLASTLAVSTAPTADDVCPHLLRCYYEIFVALPLQLADDKEAVTSDIAKDLVTTLQDSINFYKKKAINAKDDSQILLAVLCWLDPDMRSIAYDDLFEDTDASNKDKLVAGIVSLCQTHKCAPPRNARAQPVAQPLSKAERVRAKQAQLSKSGSAARAKGGAAMETVIAEPAVAGQSMAAVIAAELGHYEPAAEQAADRGNCEFWQFWGSQHIRRLCPTLCQLAMRLGAIPGTSVADEKSFSRNRSIIGLHRHSMSLQLLEWYSLGRQMIEEQDEQPNWALLRSSNFTQATEHADVVRTIMDSLTDAFAVPSDDMQEWLAGPGSDGDIM